MEYRLRQKRILLGFYLSLGRKHLEVCDILCTNNIKNKGCVWDIINLDLFSYYPFHVNITPDVDKGDFSIFSCFKAP
jgi:hypothetical protein